MTRMVTRRLNIAIVVPRLAGAGSTETLLTAISSSLYVMRTSALPSLYHFILQFMLYIFFHRTGHRMFKLLSDLKNCYRSCRVHVSSMRVAFALLHPSPFLLLQVLLCSWRRPASLPVSNPVPSGPFSLLQCLVLILYWVYSWKVTKRRPLFSYNI